MGGWPCQSLNSPEFPLNLCHQPGLYSLPLPSCAPLVAKHTKPLSVKYEPKPLETKSLTCEHVSKFKSSPRRLCMEPDLGVLNRQMTGAGQVASCLPGGVLSIYLVSVTQKHCCYH